MYFNNNNNIYLSTTIPLESTSSSGTGIEQSRMGTGDEINDNGDNIAKHPKNQQIFRGPRWQSYGKADRLSEAK